MQYVCMYVSCCNRIFSCTIHKYTANEALAAGCWLTRIRQRIWYVCGWHRYNLHFHLTFGRYIYIHDTLLMRVCVCMCLSICEFRFRLACAITNFLRLCPHKGLHIHIHTNMLVTVEKDTHTHFRTLNVHFSA